MKQPKCSKCNGSLNRISRSVRGERYQCVLCSAQTFVAADGTVTAPGVESAESKWSSGHEVVGEETRE